MKSSHTRRSAQVLVVVVAAAGLTALAWSARAQAPAAAAHEDPEQLSAEQIQQDIETFRLLHRLQLAAPQATMWAAALRPVEAARERWAKENEDPQVREALLAIRAAAAAGEPLNDGLWERLGQARRAAAGGGADDVPIGDDALWQAARAAAEQVLAGLSPEQRVALAAPEAGDRADELIEQLRHAREEPKAEFEAWRNEVAADLARDRPNQDPALAQAISGLLDQARALTPDAFHDQRPLLQGRLHDLLVGQMPDDERDERALDYLTGLCVERRRLAPCLEEYAALRGK